ncbi:MAG: prepilin-type N-terminal cleavage/methylation domain-containing protein [Verrucomicrobia bacterium]|nr:prepilin-type N-terminal cleavage/methylation domain-containing protein [Verrucomicrobiota bacterium]
METKLRGAALKKVSAPPATWRRGFTLTELLMVIGIVTLLATLLLPALSTAKGKAHSVSCLSTMRQWGLGTHLFATDNEDAIPRDGTDSGGQYSVDTGNKIGPGSPNDSIAWFNVLPPILKAQPFSNYWNSAGTDPRAALPFPGGPARIWHCPGAKAAAGDRFLKGGAFGFFSYAMNVDLKLISTINNGVQGNMFEHPNMPRIGNVRNPAAVVLFVDAAFSPTLEGYTPNPERNGVFPAARSERFSKRHSQTGANLVFVDGHAKFYKRTFITSGTSARDERFNPGVIWNPNYDVGLAWPGEPGAPTIASAD